MEFNFSQMSKIMVEEQLVPRGISDKKVLSVMLKVPREEFVPEELKNSSYGDSPLPIGNGQTISQPYIVALMTELLGLQGSERVLEIGTGSGYQTALLAELSKDVFTVERIPELSERAKKTLDNLGYKNIKFLVADGTIGWLEFSPYDIIIVTAAVDKLPQPLMEQVGENGKIVIPIGNRTSQVLTTFEKTGTKVLKKEIISCIFVPLIGKHGFPSE